MKKPGDLVGPTCYCVDINVDIHSNFFEIESESKDVHRHAGEFAYFCIQRVYFHTFLNFEKNIITIPREKYLIFNLFICFSNHAVICSFFVLLGFQRSSIS